MKTSILIAVMAFSSVSFAKGNPTGCTKFNGSTHSGKSDKQTAEFIERLYPTAPASPKQNVDISGSTKTS